MLATVDDINRYLTAHGDRPAAVALVGDMHELGCKRDEIVKIVGDVILKGQDVDLAAMRRWVFEALRDNTSLEVVVRGPDGQPLIERETRPGSFPGMKLARWIVRDAAEQQVRGLQLRELRNPSRYVIIHRSTKPTYRRWQASWFDEDGAGGDIDGDTLESAMNEGARAGSYAIEEVDVIGRRPAARDNPGEPVHLVISVRDFVRAVWGEGLDFVNRGAHDLGGGQYVPWRKVTGDELVTITGTTTGARITDDDGGWIAGRLGDTVGARNIQALLASPGVRRGNPGGAAAPRANPGLESWLGRIVPAAAYYAARIARSVKACGTISNWIGGLSVAHGIPCRVVSAPGHFFNCFPLADGRAVKVDVTALQFRLPAPAVSEARRAGDRPAIQRALDELATDPFKHVVLEILPRATGAEPDPYDHRFAVQLEHVEADMVEDGIRPDLARLHAFFRQHAIQEPQMPLDNPPIHWRRHPQSEHPDHVVATKYGYLLEAAPTAQIDAGAVSEGSHIWRIHDARNDEIVATQFADSARQARADCERMLAEVKRVRGDAGQARDPMRRNPARLRTLAAVRDHITDPGHVLQELEERKARGQSVEQIARWLVQDIAADGTTAELAAVQQYVDEVLGGSGHAQRRHVNPDDDSPLVDFLAGWYGYCERQQLGEEVFRAGVKLVDDEDDLRYWQSLDYARMARAARLELERPAAAPLPPSAPSSRSRRGRRSNGAELGARAAKAAAMFRKFHTRDWRAEGAFHPSMAIPAQLMCLGDALNTDYQSDKLNPGDGTDEGWIDYTHKHDGGVKIYAPVTGRRPGDNELVRTPAWIQRVDELTWLGKYLGGSYRTRGGRHEIAGTEPLPELFAAPSGKALFIVQNKRSLLFVLWGGRLTVERRGIVH